MTQRQEPQEKPLLLVVTSGLRNYREYLLQSIATRYRVHLIVSAEPSWERPHLAGFTVVPDTGAQSVLAAARAVAAAEPVAGVMSWHEEHIVQAALVAEELGLPGTRAEAVRRCRDKFATRTALAAARLPQPRFEAVHSTDEALVAARRLGYPVVLKPRAAGGSQGVVLVHDEDELLAQFAATRDVPVPHTPVFEQSVLVEEFLEGPEISVDSVVHGGTVVPVFVGRKEVGYAPYFEETGHRVSGADPLLTDPGLTALLAGIHQALGCTDGWTHTELKLTAEGPKLIEVNGRLGGDLIPYLGMLASGTDPGLAAADTACGRVPATEPSHARFAGIRFFYPRENDSVIGSVDFDRTALPEAIDRLEPLVAPGDVVSPPRMGLIDGRVALATAVAATEKDCAAALDHAEAALRLVVGERTKEGTGEGTGEDGRKHILVLHRIPDSFVGYAGTIDHVRHEVTYVTAPDRAATLPGAVTARVLRRPGTGDTAAEVVAAVAGLRRPDAVVALSEYDLLPAARVREALGAPGPTVAEVLPTRDKAVMKAAVAAAGLRSPAFATLDRALAEGPGALPWSGRTVLKPLAGASSEGVSSHADPAEALASAASAAAGPGGIETAAYEVEEFVEGPIIHIDGLLSGGEPVTVQASRYIGTCLGYAEGSPLGSVQIDTPAATVSWTLDALRAVGITDGPFHLEAVETAEGLVFLEVGARVGGADVVDSFQLATGVHLPSSQVRLMVEGAGELPVPRIPGPQERYGWFVVPGHTLGTAHCRVEGAEGFRDDPVVRRWVQRTEDEPIKQVITYADADVPVAGVVGPASTRELERFLTGFFAAVRVTPVTPVVPVTPVAPVEAAGEGGGRVTAVPQPPRLVVAARTSDGASVVVSDTAVAPVTVAAYPGSEFFLLWGTGNGVATVGTEPAQPVLRPFFAGPGGTRLLLARYQPDSSVPDPVGDPRRHAEELEAKLPGLSGVFESPGSGMHTTDTVDYGICLEGELHLELDDGQEVLVTPGTCVVQLGTRHAWHNRGSVPALMCFVGIGADRDS